MLGNVMNLHALLSVGFRLEDDSHSEQEFIIDTGFTGFLTLPMSLIDEMGLVFRHHTPASLADGSEIQIPVYDATILWEGSDLEVRVLGTGMRPLLGTALLKNHSLFVQFADLGTVEIEQMR